MPKLVVISGAMKDLEFELQGDQIVIGRLKGNPICLDHGSISNSHAELYLKHGKYHVKDLNSTNGTFINGKQIEKARLGHRQVLQLGQIQLMYFQYDMTTKEMLQPSQNFMSLSDTNFLPSVEGLGLKSESLSPKARILVQVSILLVGVVLAGWVIVAIVQRLKTH